MTNRCAVKKIQREKNGVDAIKQLNPIAADNFGIRLYKTEKITITKTISCGFMKIYSEEYFIG